MSKLIVFLCGLAVTVLGYRVLCATKFGAFVWMGAVIMTVAAAIWYIIWLCGTPLTMRKKDKRKKGDSEKERRFWELHAALEHALKKFPNADREARISLSGAFYLQEMFNSMDIDYDVDRDGRSEYDLLSKVIREGVSRLYALNSEIGGDGWSKRSRYVADVEAEFDNAVCGQVTDATRTRSMLQTFEKMDKVRTASMQESFSKMYGVGALGGMYGGAQLAAQCHPQLTRAQMQKLGKRFFEKPLVVPTMVTEEEGGYVFKVISGGRDVNNDGVVTLEDFEADVRLHREMGESVRANKKDDTYVVRVGDVKWVVPADYFENLEAFWGRS